MHSITDSSPSSKNLILFKSYHITHDFIFYWKDALSRTLHPFGGLGGWFPKPALELASRTVPSLSPSGLSLPLSSGGLPFFQLPRPPRGLLSHSVRAHPTVTSWKGAKEVSILKLYVSQNFFCHNIQLLIWLDTVVFHRIFLKYSSIAF